MRAAILGRLVMCKICMYRIHIETHKLHFTVSHPISPEPTPYSFHPSSLPHLPTPSPPQSSQTHSQTYTPPGPPTCLYQHTPCPHRASLRAKHQPQSISNLAHLRTRPTLNLGGRHASDLVAPARLDIDAARRATVAVEIGVESDGGGGVGGLSRHGEGVGCAGEGEDEGWEMHDGGIECVWFWVLGCGG